jgi:uncharacterized membrane protein YheB (UPF0754 family)
VQFVSVLAFNSVGDAWHVFADHPLILLLMPLFGAFIGWVTKVLMIWMIFNPIEFKGIGPIGWQGQMPKRAAKFGSEATDMILGKLIDPREIIDSLDPASISAALDDLMLEVTDDVARDIAGRRWDQLPDRAKAVIRSRVRSRAPHVVARLLEQTKANIDELFNPGYIATSHLIKDKRLLNQLIGDTIVPELQFMKRFGTLFGGVVGGAQMVVFAFTENHLLIPLAGLSVGLVSDYLALQMIFRPTAPKRYLGVLPWQGLFFKHRNEFAADYARLAATKIISPEVIMESLLDGPLADRLFGMIRGEVDDAIRRELGVIEPLVPAAIGSERYRMLSSVVVTRARERLPAATAQLSGYAEQALDLETLARDALIALSDEEYENMLRPMFKDDEWLVIALGGGLGFLVGELQVLLLEKVGGL